MEEPRIRNSPKNFGIAEGRHLWPRLSRLLTPRCKIKAQFIAAIAVSKPVVLMVLHSSGGGAERHVSDLAAYYRDAIVSLLLVVKHDGSALLSNLDPTHDLVVKFNPSQQLQELVDHLRKCKVQRLHIHHALGSERFLKMLVKDLGAPFDFTIHDYFVLSPQPHLTGIDDRFVGESLEAAQEQLLRDSGDQATAESLASWQKQWEWLVVDAERVIAPSTDTARRIQGFFPNAHVIVAPHLDRPVMDRSFRPPPLRADEPIQIAVLGTLAPHKGYRVVLETARSVRLHGLPLRFALIGSSGGHTVDRALAHEGVKVTGHYHDSDLPALLQASASHLIWYAAQCPETYSYTLTVGLRSECCLVVPDLGAFPERIQGRPWSWVSRWNGTPSEWIALFLSIREQLVAAQLTNAIREQPVDSGPETKIVASDFYRLSYLAWKSGH